MRKGLLRFCAVAVIALLALTVLVTGDRVHAGGAPVKASAYEQFVQGRVLVKFRRGVTPGQASRVIAEAGGRKTGEISRANVSIVELPEYASEEGFVHAFRSRREVEFAELDRILPPAEMIPDDPWYTNWEGHLRRIQAPTAWSTTTGSSSVIIAILDTGVDGTHEDLAPKMTPGWNTYNNNSNASDIAGHGTAVAGTAAAASNNGIGVASVCWGCGLMPVRVSDPSGYASYSAIASGLTWAADHGARVANVSYIVSDSSTVTSAAKYFQDKGGVVTSSAGNYSAFSASADNPYILTVSATDPWDLLYDFSNTGNNIDLAAPGDSFAPKMGGGYISTGGTSYSAPIVAGVVALVISADPNLTPAQVQGILKQSADDLGPTGWDTSYGAGRVNAARAVSMALGGEGAADTVPPAVGFTSPAAGAALSGLVNIQVSAGDNVGVTTVSLSVDGLSVGTDTASPYAFQWDTTLAPDGAHNLTATATDAAGNSSSASITVNVSHPLIDTSPPTVVITSPGDGSKVSINVSVNVKTSDNVGVKKVELYVDGALAATSTSAPFTTKWNTKKAAAGAHSLQCKAYDGAGNAGVSPSVTVYK
jgi:thermitase